MTKTCLQLRNLERALKALLRRASPDRQDESIEVEGIRLNLSTRQCFY